MKMNKDFSDDLSKLPDKPGVYLMHDEKDTIIYVGKAISLRNRVRQYFRPSHNEGVRKDKLVENIHHFDYIVTDSELEALVLECNLIKEHRPKYNTLLRDYETEGGDNSYFRKDGEGDITRFLNDYLPKYNATKENGYIAMFTCNHDTPRPARTLSDREMKLFAGFLMTMPGVPFVYYGDEIGMRYLDVRTKEGGYHRTGSRTPMQWDTSANYGFSKAEPEQIYLPQDSAEDAPVLSTQKADPDSLYNTYKALIAFRHSHRDLQADGDFQVILGEKGRPFVYQRGEMVIVINPSQSGAALSLEELAGKKAVFVIGSADTAHIGAQSFAVFL